MPPLSILGSRRSRHRLIVWQLSTAERAWLLAQSGQEQCELTRRAHVAHGKGVEKVFDLL
jgi:hypothetical protein